MQAIILAAGMGKRLKELTAHETKCMVTVNGVTLIERALTQLDSLNLSRIVLVVGYQSESLISFIRTLPVSTPVEIVDNPIYDTTNNIYSLFLAREYLLKEDTLLLESDIIFEKGVLDALVDDPYPTLALAAKYESWMDGGVITVDDDHIITDFLSKTQFNFCRRHDYYKTVNIYKFGADFSRSFYVPFLEAYCKALGNNEYYEQVLKVIALVMDSGIKAKILGNELWYEIDDLQDLDIAQSLFTETAEEKYRKLTSRYGGYWRYPALLDYCYLVNPYFPPRRLIEEMTSEFPTLLSQYPSGQGVNSLLAAKYFGVKEERVVVGNGAAELIKSLVSTFSGKTGVVRPSFDEYAHRMKEDSVIAFVPDTRGYTYTVDDLISYFSGKGISSLVIINPDNPSGHMLREEDVEKLIEWTKKESISLVVDESFIDFSDNGPEATL
ncbi:MAG: aminotransferase class I/II-fold pyridoxal phosphate-dependent enzyme, partial [Sphaerochaetaceae bacterium]|nr:aminotransferase class I/II-fold pyridoxal phosphate-dependent enzyme [Sphaerochaetaceae bacterium]